MKYRLDKYGNKLSVLGCGKCESHCPQHIDIRNQLKNARKELEGPLYTAAAKVVKVLKLYG